MRNWAHFFSGFRLERSHSSRALKQQKEERFPPTHFLNIFIFLSYSWTEEEETKSGSKVDFFLSKSWTPRGEDTILYEVKIVEKPQEVEQVHKSTKDCGETPKRYIGKNEEVFKCIKSSCKFLPLDRLSSKFNTLNWITLAVLWDPWVNPKSRDLKVKWRRKI